MYRQKQTNVGDGRKPECRVTGAFHPWNLYIVSCIAYTQFPAARPADAAASIWEGGMKTNEKSTEITLTTEIA